MPAQSGFGCVLSPNGTFMARPTEIMLLMPYTSYDDGTKASLPRSPLAPNGTRLAPVELVALIGVMLLLVKITAALVSLLNPSPHCVIVAGFQNMDERLGPPAAAPAIEVPWKYALCSWR